MRKIKEVAKWIFIGWSIMVIMEYIAARSAIEDKDLEACKHIIGQGWKVTLVVPGLSNACLDHFGLEKMFTK